MPAKFAHRDEALAYAERLFKLSGNAMAVLFHKQGFKVIRYMSRIDKDRITHVTRKGVHGGGRKTRLNPEMIAKYGRAAAEIAGVSPSCLHAYCKRRGIQLNSTPEKADSIESFIASSLGEPLSAKGGKKINTGRLY